MIDNKKEKKDKSDLKDSQKYDFMKETIKDEKTSKKSFFIKKIIAIVSAGIIFGVAAAGAFAVSVPFLISLARKNLKSEKIEIKTDEKEEKEEADGLGLNYLGSYEDSTNTFQYLEAISEGIRDLSGGVRMAMVTVQGYKEQENVLDHSYLDSQNSYGVIIESLDNEIFVLTESGVADNSAKLEIILGNGTVVPATVNGCVDDIGIAVISAFVDYEQMGSLRSIDLGNSYVVKRGQNVLALGGPTGYVDSVAFGRITSISEVSELCDGKYRLLVTDLPGGSESSGILVNLQGEVIGLIIQTQNINGYTAPVVRAYSISELKPVIEKLVNSDKVSYLGIFGTDVTKELQKSRNIPAGICVEKIDEDSPAGQSGLQNGDIIVQIENDTIVDMADVNTCIQKYDFGEKLELLVKRKTNSGYTDVKLYVTVGERE